MSLIMTKDKLETKEKVFVPPPEELKETKVRRFVFHNNKGQVEAKIEGPIKKNCNSIKALLLFYGPFGHHNIKKRLKLSVFRRQATMRIHV